MLYFTYISDIAKKYSKNIALWFLGMRQQHLVQFITGRQGYLLLLCVVWAGDWIYHAFLYLDTIIEREIDVILTLIRGRDDVILTLYLAFFVALAGMWQPRGIALSSFYIHVTYFGLFTLADKYDVTYWGDIIQCTCIILYLLHGAGNC